MSQFPIENLNVNQGDSVFENLYITDRFFYDFSEMDSVVTEVVNSGKSIKMLNQHGKEVLRFSVLWKNICQGGQTPCFTVFVGNAYS